MSGLSPREAAPYQRRLSPATDRRIVLPLREGASVHVRLASRWERIAAFFLDILVLGSTQLLVIALLMGVSFGSEEIQIGVVLGAAYLLQAAYFSVFEALWNGQSPGKRLLEIRTVRLDGEALSAWVLWLRANARMMEQGWPIILAILAYFAAPSLFPFIAPFAALIVALTLLFPFLNVHNQRIADFIAGTVVIEEPERKTRFLPPLVEGTSGPPFPTSLLHQFGTYELHVLESILAQARDGDDSSLQVVSEQLGQRMELPPPPHNEARAFVESFYLQLGADISRNAHDPKSKRWR